ncbi:MAG: hypothetical protein HYS08_06280 [Chlamydiae bacterium]|nr:hypothetical protein [Chlamydiota bacterium]MBI3266985.1 hypothetical protein [Chlamydiota bacterium]
MVNFFSDFQNRLSAVVLSLFSLLSLFLLSGCGKPSFPEGKVLDSVKKMCQDEYKIDVEAKIVGRNLGAHIVLENIFDREQGLTKDATEHIGDLLLGVTRISLSTDAPLQFFAVVASDKTIPGVEAVFVRYVDDVKRYLVGNVSREDFFQRLIIDVRFNPSLLAERTVLNFFSNLSKGNSRTLLANYLRKNSDSTEFSLAFLRTILEMKLKENVHFEILEIKTKPIPEERALVYCRVRETYEAKLGYKPEDFTFPSDFVYDYLFVIGASNYLPEIRQIIPLDYKDEDGTLKKKSFPDEYRAFQNVETWSKQDFLLEDITLPQFLVSQMAQRIVRKAREMEPNSKQKEKKPAEASQKIALGYKVESVKGHYLTDGGEKEHTPSFFFDFKISQGSMKEIPQTLCDLSLEVVQDVVEKYHFEDYKEVRLSKTSSKDIKVFPKNTPS